MNMGHFKLQVYTLNILQSSACGGNSTRSQGGIVDPSDANLEAKGERDVRACGEDERFLADVLGCVEDVFWVASNGVVRYVSPAYERVWGLSRKRLYEAPASFLTAVHRCFPPAPKVRSKHRNQWFNTGIKGFWPGVFSITAGTARRETQRSMVSWSCFMLNGLLR